MKIRSIVFGIIPILQQLVEDRSVLDLGQSIAGSLSHDPVMVIISFIGVAFAIRQVITKIKNRGKGNGK